LVFAWIDDGEQSVNISLIREGAFPGGVMFDAIDYFNQIKFHPNADEMPRRIVSNDRYDAFIKRVIPAENDAKAERRGIWSDKYKEIREQEGIE
jgi:endonuclease YncB( thermonuclease family)